MAFCKYYLNSSFTYILTKLEAKSELICLNEIYISLLQMKRILDLYDEKYTKVGHFWVKWHFYETTLKL